MSIERANKIKELAERLLSIEHEMEGLKQEQLNINFELQKIFHETKIESVTTNRQSATSSKLHKSMDGKKRPLAELIIEVLQDGNPRYTPEIINEVLQKQDGLKKESVRSIVKRLATNKVIKRVGYSQYQLNQLVTIRK